MPPQPIPEIMRTAQEPGGKTIALMENTASGEGYIHIEGDNPTYLRKPLEQAGMRWRNSLNGWVIINSPHSIEAIFDALTEGKLADMAVTTQAQNPLPALPPDTRLTVAHPSPERTPRPPHLASAENITIDVDGHGLHMRLSLNNARNHAQIGFNFLPGEQHIKDIENKGLRRYAPDGEPKDGPTWYVPLGDANRKVIKRDVKALFTEIANHMRHENGLEPLETAAPGPSPSI